MDQNDKMNGLIREPYKQPCAQYLNKNNELLS